MVEMTCRMPWLIVTLVRAVLISSFICIARRIGVDNHEAFWFFIAFFAGLQTLYA